MSITACPKCGHQISTGVDRCPHCGTATPQQWHGVNPAVRFAAAFLGVLSLALYFTVDDTPIAAGVTLRWICVLVGVMLILAAVLVRSRKRPAAPPQAPPDYTDMK